MNYERGRTPILEDELLLLSRSDEGFMSVSVPFEGDARTNLQYGLTLKNYFAIRDH